MKKQVSVLILFCILISGICKSQQYRFIYYLDGNLLTVPKSKALVIGKGFNDGKNGFQLDCYSVFNNTLLMSWHFIDSSLADINGLFRSYHINGRTEKEGNYIYGYEEGVWQTWDSLGRKTDSVFYKKGLPYIKAKYSYYHKNGAMSSYSLTDSIRDTFQETAYDEKKELTTEVFFVGQRGVIKTYYEGQVKTDSLFTREEVEASYPGGDTGWREYLERNVNRDIAANNGAPTGKYTVIIKFVVNKEGKLEDITVETNPGFGVAEEVIRVIKKSPKWKPAVQYGRKVKAYRRQPLTLAVEN